MEKYVNVESDKDTQSVQIIVADDGYTSMDITREQAQELYNKLGLVLEHDF